MARLKKDAKIALIGGVELFKNFSKKDLGDVARVADEVSYEGGEFLGQQGSPGSEAFVVVSGSVIVRRNGRKVATLGKGDVAGEMSVIDGETRSADLVAGERCEALVIGRREFQGLIDNKPTLQLKLLKTLAGRLREADRKLYG